MFFARQVFVRYLLPHTSYASALTNAQQRKQAQDQITQILSAGGTVPQSLALAAGYDPAYIGALTEARTRQEAQEQANALCASHGGTD